jgi:hypothetical protein
MIDRTVILDSLVLGFDSDLNNQNTLVNELESPTYKKPYGTPKKRKKGTKIGTRRS